MVEAGCVEAGGTPAHFGVEAGGMPRAVLRIGP